MNKNDLVAAIKEKTGLTKEQSKNALDAALDAISETLINGDSVALIGFGSFVVKDKPARVARNPQTGAEVKIPAKKAPAFKPGKSLKEAVNK